MLTKIQFKLKRLLTVNWRPKLFCLAAAILLWTWVQVLYVSESKEDEWDVDDVRFTLPE